jgi:hypothetical protein
MRALLLVLGIVVAACDDEPAPASAPERETRLKTTGAPVPPPPPEPPRPPPDRCVQVADHFEPWRKNPLWAEEVSPRDRLIADCREQRWSKQLTDCLLAAGGPLDLDSCISLSPGYDE